MTPRKPLPLRPIASGRAPLAGNITQREGLPSDPKRADRVLRRFSWEGRDERR